MNRKRFLQIVGLAVFSVGTPFVSSLISQKNKNDLFFDISLAQWSLHRSLREGRLDHLDFPAYAKNEFGIDAVEYVNQFFADKAENKKYLDEMNLRCEDLGIDQVLIMVDGEGRLAQSDEQKRLNAIENHYKWVAAAEHLNCQAIRVNLYGKGTASKAHSAAVDSLGQLSDFAQDYGINIIVENHGGYSSDGQWLAGVISEVGMKNCGTLPDFGNFCIESEAENCIEAYDRYKGVSELMPFAKGVSAKSYDFNKNGEETTIDFEKMLSIVYEAGYDGYIGIEYEGQQLSEDDGIKVTKILLQKVGRCIEERDN